MTDENKELNEEMELEMDSEIEINEEKKDELKDAINNQFEKIRTQSMLLGAQVAMQVIYNKIIAVETSPKKTTNNDNKRLIKEIKKFCETGLSKKVNLDGTTENITEENNTKLMEE